MSHLFANVKAKSMFFDIIVGIFIILLKLV